MAKQIDAYIKLQVPAGQANPSPPVGPALGQHGLNIMDFCKAFNAETQAMEQGLPAHLVGARPCIISQGEASRGGGYPLRASTGAHRGASQGREGHAALPLEPRPTFRDRLQFVTASVYYYGLTHGVVCRECR